MATGVVGAVATAPEQVSREPLPEASRWEAWDAFIEANPATGFLQSSWWADFRSSHDYGHFLLMLKDGGAIVGGALVLRYPHNDESCFYAIPEGPVLPEDPDAAAQVFGALMEAVRERQRADDLRVSHVRIEPRWAELPSFVSGFSKPPFTDRYTEPRNTLCIDLRPPIDRILAQMKPKGRYNIRVARRHGVTVVEDTSMEGLEDFLGIYDETAARQGMNAKPRDYFEGLTALLLRVGRGSMYFAELEGRRLAAALVVFHGRRATYFFGGSSEAHREVMAPYALHFDIMRRAKEMGHDWYDLWGVAPVGQPEHSWSGLSAFKRKFGGVEVGLVPTLDYVLDRGAYERYLAIERGPARRSA